MKLFLSGSKLLLPLIIFAFTFLLHSDTLGFGLTNMDDVNMISAAEKMKDGFWPAKVFRMDISMEEPPQSPFYRPMLMSSYILDSYAASDGFFFFHLGNVIVNSLFCVLLFLFLKQAGAAEFAAFSGTVFFSLIPSLATAVAWIPGRNDSLMSVFAIASLMSFLNWIKRLKIRDIVFCQIFFLASLLTKESAVLLPFLFCAALWIKGKLGDRRYLVSLSAASLVPAAVYIFMRAGASLVQISAGAFPFYKIFLVPALSWKFVSPMFAETAPVMTALTLATLIFSALMILFSGNNRKRVIAGLCWFYLFITPPLIGSEYYPHISFFLTHRFYFPLAGLVFAAVSMPAAGKLNLDNRFFCAAACLLFLFMAGLTRIYGMSFRDMWTFNQPQCKEDPYFTSWAKFYYDEGLYGLSEVYLRKALASGPSPLNVNIYSYLGLIALRRNDIKKAYEDFSEELKLNPNHEFAKRYIEEIKAAGYRGR